MTAPFVYDGAMNGSVFDQILVPTLMPGDFVVRDNLPAHERTASVRRSRVPRETPVPAALFAGVQSEQLRRAQGPASSKGRTFDRRPMGRDRTHRRLHFSRMRKLQNRRRDHHSGGVRHDTTGMRAACSLAPEAEVGVKAQNGHCQHAWALAQFSRGTAK